MQNSDKSFQFIKCSTLSSTKNIIKSPGNSIHYHCEEICSWMRRPGNTEKKEKTKFLQWPTTVLLPNFLKIRDLRGDLHFPNILKHSLYGSDFPKSEETYSFRQTFKRTARWVSNKATVNWKFGHCSACVSLKIWIIPHEH